MNDDVWKRAELESPCVKICVVHPDSKLCVGCLRTLDEIGNWSRMTTDERRAIMSTLKSRAGQLARRRGGRLGRTAGQAEA